MDRLFETSKFNSKYLSFLGQRKTEATSNAIKPFTLNNKRNNSTYQRVPNVHQNNILPPILSDSPQVRRNTTTQSPRPARVPVRQDSDGDSLSNLSSPGEESNEESTFENTPQPGPSQPAETKTRRKRKSTEIIQESSAKRRQSDKIEESLALDLSKDSADFFENGLRGFAGRKSSTPQKANFKQPLSSVKKRIRNENLNSLKSIAEKFEDSYLSKSNNSYRRQNPPRSSKERAIQQMNNSVTSVVISGMGGSRCHVPQGTFMKPSCPPPRKRRENPLQFQKDNGGFLVPPPPRPKSSSEKSAMYVKKFAFALRELHDNCNEAQVDYELDIMERELTFVIEEELSRQKRNMSMAWYQGDSFQAPNFPKGSRPQDL